MRQKLKDKKSCTINFAKLEASRLKQGFSRGRRVFNLGVATVYTQPHIHRYKARLGQNQTIAGASCDGIHKEEDVAVLREAKLGTGKLCADGASSRKRPSLLCLRGGPAVVWEGRGRRGVEHRRCGIGRGWKRGGRDERGGFA